MSTGTEGARDGGRESTAASRDASRLGTVVATVVGNAYLVVGTLALSTLVIFSWLISPRGRLGFAIARLWARGLLTASGVRLRTEHAEASPPSGVRVYMPNHQSRFDIPALLATVPGETRFLAKRSLLRIPVFGWALWVLRFVPVDREDRSRARDMFGEASRRLAAGVSLVVFPEGTRSADGRLLPFQRGGFLLAMRSGCPIVPVGVRGTLEVQPRGTFRIRPGEVVVRYGEPVSTTGLAIGERKALMAEIRDRVANLVELENA